LEKLKPISQDMLHLDAMRFFAATAVVFAHWIISNWKPLPVRSDHIDFPSLAVDLFFFISGIVMFQLYSHRLSSWREFRQFMQRRVARLYPMHLLTFFIFALFGLGAYALHLQPNHPELYRLNGVIPNLLLIQAFPVIHHGTFDAASWSISAEMGCYFLLPMVIFLYRRKWWAPALIGLAMAIALTYVFRGWAWTNDTYGYGIFRAMPTFLIGVTVGGSSSMLRRIPYPNLLFPIFAGGLIWLGFMGVSRGILLVLVYLVGITGFACDVQKTAGRFICAVAPFGQLTYSIYLIHMVFEPTLFHFVYARIPVSPWVHNCLILSTFIPLLVLSYLSFKYFETPARRWVTGLGRNRGARAAQPVTGLGETPQIESSAPPLENSAPPTDQVVA
jgi:peptidoglycan/LPS O-acetylase OafA/YrhL